MNFIPLFLALFFCIPLLGQIDDSPETEIYRSISDLTHPTRSDYLKIQKALKSKKRSKLLLMRQAITPGGALYDYNWRAKRFQMVGKWPWQSPQFAIIPHQCSFNEKSICVVSYASFNKHYPEGIKLLNDALKKIGFKGHFVYRIGGWPDLEGGSLTLAHVPYAFKPCFLRELERLGYESVLWLDASIRPLQNLDSVFKQIASSGYYFYSAGHTLEQYCTKETMEALGEPPEHAAHISSVLAGIFGLNLAHPLGNALARQWYSAAQKETPFFSPRPEQNVLSILLHQMQILDRQPPQTVAWSSDQRNEQTLFFVDWTSIQ